MGGASSEISDSTTEVLLEAAYFTPMAIARTSKRLGLRTEASARFERGCDPWGIDASVNRFSQLLARERRPASRSATASSTSGARSPSRSRWPCPSPGSSARSGVPLTGSEIAALLDPIGFTTVADEGGPVRRASPGPGADQSARRAPGAVRDRRRHRGSGPDVRVRQHPAPHADLAPAGPSHPVAAVAPPGQERARAASAPRRAGPTRSSPRRPIAGSDCGVRPCGCPTRSSPRSRTSAARSCRACWGRWPTTPDRRQGSIRLFEVGVVFSHPDEGGHASWSAAAPAVAQTACAPRRA